MLFVNCCIRSDSRTEKLARGYLNSLSGEYDIHELNVPDLDILPFDECALDQRNSDAACEDFSGDTYALAHQFADADRIVIAAPYWDCLFPAKLKVYLEHICVCGITFAYDQTGKPVKFCRADTLVYITTAGGYLAKPSGLQVYLTELCTLFSIENFLFYAAEALDIFPEKCSDSLNNTLLQIYADENR